MDVKKGEIFNAIQVKDLPRNTFDLTHQHATTIDFANIVPICIMEAMPGDSFQIASETFMRLQPMITPMMHRSDFTVHYFYVPLRILWDGFEDFITGNLALTSGLNTPAAPYFTANAINSAALDGRGSLLNYMGCELDFAAKLVGNGFDQNISALPLAAYQKIYYDYYIPRELVPPTTDFIKLVNGDNSANVAEYGTMRKKGWLRDYFTSALPYAQKGDEVTIPVEGLVVPTNEPATVSPAGGWRQSSNSATTTAGQTGAPFIEPGSTKVVNTSGAQIFYDPQGSLKVENTVTTINDLRRAIRLQEWLEKNARAGTRYSESLRVHYNVISSDARLQRAEYITGVKSPIIVSEVLNTAGTEGELPQGNMSGHGIGVADSYGDSFYCEEHGFIIGVISCTPRPAYTSGLPRMFTERFDFMDYPWIEFANIGEQEIKQIEIQADLGGGKNPETVFGYIPRYAEYKFKNDMITGDFADAGSSSASGDGPLRTWVMQRNFFWSTDFQNAELSESFITSDIQEVASAPFAVDDTPLMVQQINKIKVSRQLPVFGTPTF